MGRMGDVDYAASMRDKIIRICEGVVDRLRPDVRTGKVYDFDVNSGQATVIFAGETGDSLTYIKFGKNMTPTSSILMHQDPLAQAVDITVTADIVRVAGKPGAYYIDSFISGTPASWTNMFDPNVAFGSGYNGQTAYDEVGKIIYVWSDLNGGWMKMVDGSDSGWLPLTPQTAGDAPFANATWTYFEYKIVSGKLIYIRGSKNSLTSLTAANENFVNFNLNGTAIPTAIRPSQQVNCEARYDDAPSTLVLIVNGFFTVTGGSARTYAAGTQYQFSCHYVI